MSDIVKGKQEDSEKVWFIHPESCCAWVDDRDKLPAIMDSDGNVMEAGPAIKGTKEELFSYYVRPEIIFNGWDIKEGLQQ